MDDQLYIFQNLVVDLVKGIVLFGSLMTILVLINVVWG